ncbi:mannosyl-3-phosphoglycerate phosphatase [Roseivirga pacifica]|uniref:mannosyl-3-phosphoglycerate phosphatase n=1 Tax=Roseivirga pacifica TaxID=1267423 RepID=UPI003BAF56AD
MKKLVFTDLDGTLLDLKSYSFMQSIEAIEKLKSAGVPVIFCSSKTRNEQEFYRESLGVRDPFIVENGSAIYIPKGYFKQPIPYNTYVTGDYEVICLGKSVDSIRSVLLAKREQLGLNFMMYEDLPPEGISMLTGLDLKSARRAKARDYSETILRGSLSESFYTAIDANGFRSIPGSKFETVISKYANKGKAVEILIELYARENDDLETFAIGDSQNDAEMLAAVDNPFLVQRPNGEWAELADVTAQGISGVGPQGWSRVVDLIMN